VLNQFPEFVEFHSAAAKSDNARDVTESLPASGETPEEVIERAHQSLRNELAGDILRRIKELLQGQAHRASPTESFPPISVYFP
jgi:restriction endonuclease Mrr